MKSATFWANARVITSLSGIAEKWARIFADHPFFYY
jgi:hypothetical protein